jgi:hypothetical protein
VTEWTGRTTLRDACAASKFRQSADAYHATQYGCRTGASRVKGSGSTELMKCTEGGVNSTRPAASSGASGGRGAAAAAAVLAAALALVSCV